MFCDRFRTMSRSTGNNRFMSYIFLIYLKLNLEIIFFSFQSHPCCNNGSATNAEAIKVLNTQMFALKARVQLLENESSKTRNGSSRPTCMTLK